MKKIPIILSIALLNGFALQAWWDPGHLLTAMIAYMNLDETARARVDALTENLGRDYPYVNHFIVAAAWPDDLKAEGVHTYDSWHYTNIPYNPDGVALPPQPETDIIWAINECRDVLRDDRARDIDKARHLGFLVHFVADLHQPMHSTSMFTNELPGGNRGGNEFALEGAWRNLHALWDDGCGYLTAYNDIRPYGEPKTPLSQEAVARIRNLALTLTQEFPKDHYAALDTLDPAFWALESHRLAVRYGYRGVNGMTEEGRRDYLEPGEEPSAMYLEQGQAVVREQLVLAGYRLANVLNELLGEGE
jgi:hypothetical protein